MKLRSRGFPPTFRDMVEPTGNEAGMLNLVGCVFGCNHRIRDWFDAMSDRGGGGGGAGPTRGGAARGNSNPRGRTANAGRATAQRGGARGVAGGRGGAQAPAGRGSGRGNSGSDVAQAPVRRYDASDNIPFSWYRSPDPAHRSMNRSLGGVRVWFA